MKLAFIDLETSGTDPKVHGIWEIGLVLREDLQDTEYSWRLRLDMSAADPNALRVTRYYSRPYVSPSEPYSLAACLAPLLANSVLVGINIWFDRDFLIEFLRTHREVLATDYHMVEVCSLVKGRLGPSAKDMLRSDDLAKKIGIDPAKYKRHEALSDARFARDLYDKVMT